MTSIKTTVSIGRENTNDIVIVDPRVSRNHAIITDIGNGNYQINDLSSTNGTFVNGIRVTQQIINANDSVEVAGNLVNWFIAFSSQQSQQEPSSIQESPFAKILKTFSIGSSSSNDIVIADNLISDKHAQISLLEDCNYFIQDLNSNSGTFINGVRVQSKNFTKSDLVKIASSDLPLEGLEHKKPKHGFYNNNKKTIYIVLSVLLILGISFFVFNHYNNKLDREQAKEIIIKKFGFPSTVTEKFPYGVVNYMRNLGGSNISAEKKLAKENMITFTYQGIKSDMFFSYNSYYIELTSEGKKYKTGEITSSDGIKYYYAKVAEKVFGEVTGIQEYNDGKKATVNYTWKYSSITPFGEAISLKNKELNTSDKMMKSRTIYTDGLTFKKKVTMVKYDDGWRIEK